MKTLHLILYSFFLFLLAGHLQVHGQEVSEVNLLIEGDEIPFKKVQSTFANHEEAVDYIAELKKDLIVRGYLTSSFDSIELDSSRLRTHFYLGQKYHLARLAYAEENEAILKNIKGLKRGRNNIFSLAQMTNLQASTLKYLEQSGHPFGVVNFDSVSVENSHFNLHMNVEKGPLIKFDTLTNAHENKVSINYLKAYTGIFPGKPYNENKVKTLDAKLREIPFLQLERSSEVYFKNDEAKINLFLKPKKVNRFDFLLGVLPNSTTNGKVLITGEMDVRLMNPFGTGKRLDINWKRLKPRSQDLYLYFDYPYIAASPLGADVSLTLNKRDTSYININYNIGINYQVRPSEKIVLYVENEQSLLLSVDSNRIKQTKKLPSVLDSRNTLFGLSYSKENLDYLFNPRKGYSFAISTFAGNKKIKPSGLITSISDPSFSFEDIYNEVEKNSIKWGFSWRADFFQPIGKRQTFHFKIMGRSQQNSGLLENELYRIGGNQNLRGFDEEIFLVSTYNILTTEYRFLTGKNAFFNVFLDFGLLHNQVSESTRKLDFPLGFGTGVNLETKAGVFGINYALGRSNEIPFQFKSAKIHFGYVNVF